MNNDFATVIIDSFAAKQSGKHYACPRCGRDAMDLTPARNALSRCADVHICDTCGMDEAIRAFKGKQLEPQEWAIAKDPEKWDMVHTYYYTFGSDPNFPQQNGWVEVLATSWSEAHSKFRAVYPDRHPHILNCAFFYEEDRWRQMDPPNNWPGYQYYGTIE